MAYIEYQPRIINDKRRLILLFALLCVLRINAAPYLWSESFMTGTLQDDSVCMGGGTSKAPLLTAVSLPQRQGQDMKHLCFLAKMS